MMKFWARCENSVSHRKTIFGGTLMGKDLLVVEEIDCCKHLSPYMTYLRHIKIVLISNLKVLDK